MREINLKFEVHAYRPKWAVWSADHQNSIYSDPRYRIYINDNLITERNWIWDNSILLVENIWIQSDETHYIVKLDPILLKNPAQATFSIKNLNIVNIQADSTKVNDLQVNFTLR